jgi:hypothetical protein
MPELKDLATTTIVDATIVEKTEPDVPTDVKPEVTDAKPETVPAVKPEVKPVKKAKQKVTVVPAVPITPEAKTEVTEPVVAKSKKVKKEKVEISEESKFQRPPLEQIVKDFEIFLVSLKLKDQKIERLGYKCGKMIFGIPNTEGKDFRIVAFKARKKSKTVAGKSRCVFYFGTTAKVDMIGTSTSKFGKCSVQSSKPVELKLDKVTFTSTFNKDTELVLKTLKDLAKVTIEHKTKIWEEQKKKPVAE